MRNLHLFLSLTAAILLVMQTACQQQPPSDMPAAPASPVAAVIGGKNIYESDIDEAIAALPENLHLNRSDMRLRRRLLEVLLRRQALSQQAEALHLDQAPDIRRQIIKARNDILIRSLRQWKMRRIPDPDNAAIEAYYNAHPGDFTIPEQVHARHILLANKKQAESVRRELRHGRDFAALAAEKSRDDGTRALGGDLNWFPRGVMVKPFEDAVFKLKKVGDISPPVKTRFGWHIIQLLGKRAASRQSLDEARESIIGILKNRALEAWLDTLVAQAGAEVRNPQYRKDAETRNAP